MIVGHPADARTRALRTEVTHRLVPASVTIVASDENDSIPLLAGRPAHAFPTAYVCEHYVCQAPTTDPEQLRSLLVDSS